MSYAQTTSVSTDKSETQIKGILRKHGADSIMIGEIKEKIAIQFSMSDRNIRFIIPIPTLDEDEVKFTQGGKIRPPAAQKTALQQAFRQRYRLLFLVVKAKLEAVDSGVVAFDDEFLAHTVLPNGQTVSQWAGPKVTSAYETGQMPPLLGFEG